MLKIQLTKNLCCYSSTFKKDYQEQCKKHDHIDFIPVEAANVGVRMVCDNGVSDLCQKNADIILKLDPTKCSAEGLGTKVAEDSWKA